MSDLYKKVEEYIKNNTTEEVQGLMPHFVRTAYWVEQIEPDASEALIIAGILHDADKFGGFKSLVAEAAKNNQGFKDNEKIRMHEENAGNKAEEILISLGANKELAENVRVLVLKHEEGGNTDQNILKDADSISFLENNLSHFLGMLDTVGYKKVREKFDYMYERITSEKAKEIARPMYEEAIRILEGKNG